MKDQKNKKIIKKKLIIILILILIIITGYFKFRKKNIQKKHIVYTVTSQVLKDSIQADGKIYPLDTRKIFIDNSLKVKKLNFHKGDSIKKGQVIIIFDTNERDSLNRSIEKSNLQTLKLKRDLQTAQELLAIGGSTINTIKDLKLELREKEIDLKEYEENLSRLVTEIKSPVTGTITSMQAEENYRVNTEVELFEIANLSDVEIKLFVPEYDVSKLKKGFEVEIKPGAYNNGKNLKGKILSIGTFATDDKKYSASNEAYVEVKVKLDKNPNDLKPGFTVTGKIYTFHKKDVLLIPRVAFTEIDGKDFVYKIDKENILHKVTIITGDSNNENIEITDGLKKGDRIIAIIDSTLKDGEKIKIAK